MWFFNLSGRCCSVEVCKNADITAGSEGAKPRVPQSVTSEDPAQPTHEAVTDPDMAGAAPGGGVQGQGQTEAKEAKEAKPAAAAVAKTGANAAVPPIPTKGAMDSLETNSVHSNTSTQKNSTRSAYSGVSSIGSEFLNEHIPEHQREVERIKSQMKTFVKSMVRGKDMNVLSVDGQLRACTCSFDRKLRNYNITINKDVRSIPLTRFREVFQGTEPDDIATPLDELCATFVLDSGECLSFRFKDEQERENFAMGLQIIVDGHT